MSEDSAIGRALREESDRVLGLMSIQELEALRRLVDVRILDRVDELQRDGKTYREIGALLGVTGAAVHARYATGRHLIEKWRPMPWGREQPS